MDNIDAAFLLFATIGHITFWIALNNRVHALGISQKIIKIASAALWLIMLSLPCYLLIHGFTDEPAFSSMPLTGSITVGYNLFCCLALLVMAFQRTAFLIIDKHDSSLLISDKLTIESLNERFDTLPVDGLKANILARIPGNEIFSIHLHDEELMIPHLPQELDGLVIAHLSDLHISGRITRPFYEEIVRITNDLKADIITISGDLFDQHACLEWAPEVFKKLTARYGCYSILGNHDLRVGVENARNAINRSSIIDLGQSCHELQINGQRIVLAGNELPWMGIKTELENRLKPYRNEPLTKILLAHSPDQFRWAAEYGFDLVLSGHAHGGQIQLPLLGAILSPCLTGVRYTDGVFRQRDTVLHVSRGVSSLTPLRLRCPPEISRIVLRCPNI